MQFRRLKIPGGTYFFTLLTHNRLKYFESPDAVDVLHKACSHVREKHPFETKAYVIFPDHLHCLWKLPENDADFPTRWRLIKYFVTRRIQAPGTIWQHRYWEHPILDDDDFRRHLDYIHFNPVKHNFVESPEQWPHSSYSRYLENGWYEPGWENQMDVKPVEFGE